MIWRHGGNDVSFLFSQSLMREIVMANITARTYVRQSGTGLDPTYGIAVSLAGTDLASGYDLYLYTQGG